MSSNSLHREFILAQFSLYVHKSGKLLSSWNVCRAFEHLFDP